MWLSLLVASVAQARFFVAPGFRPPGGDGAQIAVDAVQLQLPLPARARAPASAAARVPSWAAVGAACAAAAVLTATGRRTAACRVSQHRTERR